MQNNKENNIDQPLIQNQQGFPTQQDYHQNQQHVLEQQDYVIPDNQHQAIKVKQLLVYQTVQEQGQKYPSTANGLREPLTILCPYCKHVVQTLVTFEASASTYICCLVLCITIPFLFFIPFCQEGCQRAIQSCQKCGKQIGSAS
ncbi:hypothetical protein pb186bvf_016429 [Paramecium bursaria]